MTTQEVAEKLVAYCTEGQALQAIEELYSQDIVSVEAMAMPGGSREMSGKEAVVGKANWWMSEHEVHSAKVEGPLVSGNRFCVRFVYDVTNKPSGRRIVMDELAVYKVADGQIVHEEFMYGA